MLDEPEPPIQNNPLTAVGGVVGAAAGWGLSTYVGASLWIPAIAGVVLGVLFAKTPVSPPRFRGAIAVTAAHVVWMLVGAIATGLWLLVGPDIVVLSLAIVFLWAKPSFAAAVVLGGLQLGSLAYNGYLIFGEPFASPDHRALTMHIVLRVLVLVLLVVGYRSMRAGERSEPS